MINSTTFNWEESFEKEFGLTNNQTPNYWRLIIGQQQYKQNLGNISLKSSRPSNYSLLGDVAFLVNDWIKIQDSMEMIFQLFCYSNYTGMGQAHAKPLKILGYLREKKIPSDEFGDYLFRRHKVILLNIVDIKKNYNQTRYLKNLLNMYQNNRVLFVGKKAEKYYTHSLFYNCIKGYIIHPSGVNLNKNNLTYYNSWYQLSYLYKHDPQFSLQDFKIF